MTSTYNGTLYAAVHGELVSHPWYDRAASASDAYSLFYARSSAMGWLDEATESTLGIWGMNDAEQDITPGPEPARVAWMQVSLTGPLPGSRPMPTQEFLACADDVIARIGTLRLQGLRLLLPVQNLVTEPAAASERSGSAALLQQAGWFADVAPQAGTGVRVTLDGGRNRTIVSAAPEMVTWMGGLKQDVFTSVALTSDRPVTLQPSITDQLWCGPELHHVTLTGTLAEWSLDCLGWLAAFLAEAACQQGVTSPLMLLARPIEEQATSSGR